MFAKLSALTLCVSFVSALNIVVPLVVHPGNVIIQATDIAEGVPALDFSLAPTNDQLNVTEFLGLLTVKPQITVLINASIPEGNYTITARYHDEGAFAAVTNPFLVKY